jgi:AraC-like DNA-binding protein
MIRDVEHLLQVTITIHDILGVMRTPEGQSIFPDKSTHFNAFCQAGRNQNARFDKRCVDYCMSHIHDEATRRRDPFVSYCWKYAREVIIPIFQNGELHLVIYAGVFKDETAPPPQGQSALPRQLKTLRDNLPDLSTIDVERSKRILHTLGLGLLKEVEQLYHFEDHALDRKNVIQRFIYNNAHKNVTLRDLAAVLYLSSSRTSHLVKDLFGEPFQNLLIEERIKRAKILLRDSSRPIQYIATQCGFNDQYYFNRQFRKHVGIPPGRFRSKAS